ncbi:hydroxyisourate hydrolase [Amylibacter kogurei]|uniref:5-hydroxyisourate hydrolase n=1 Tax=Paramylibacter kogurei TaxID=1889778 RepID=A0A2G5K762_9RHOB|nr:hydroxyisourate hydrolase [Amylibacter kogurei]PIB24700.1 hydroxyisourate hydrolase [Amylibacter kogurei]
MPKGYLTTHVLDTASGAPAAGLEIQLYRIDGDTAQHITTMKTNADGRTDSPILPADDFQTGQYRLDFLTGSYLRAQNDKLAEPLFLDTIPISFGMNDADAHYHVPLLLSPFGYSTYRGS